MPSTISWLDFSNSDRCNMVEVISLFKQRNTRDELGLGQIWGGIAVFLSIPSQRTLLGNQITMSRKTQKLSLNHYQSLSGPFPRFQIAIRKNDRKKYVYI